MYKMLNCKFTLISRLLRIFILKLETLHLLHSFSAFVARLFNVNDGLLENVNTSPKPKHVEEANMLESDSDIEVDEETSAVDKGIIYLLNFYFFHFT